MVMYISRYGMTVDRVFSSAFMVFTAVVFLSMVLRCFSEKVKILHTAFIAAGIILLILGARGHIIPSLAAGLLCDLKFIHI